MKNVLVVLTVGIFIGVASCKFVDLINAYRSGALVGGTHDACIKALYSWKYEHEEYPYSLDELDDSKLPTGDFSNKLFEKAFYTRLNGGCLVVVGTDFRVWHDVTEEESSPIKPNSNQPDD